MKKLTKLNWSYIAVIALAAALYIGFDELIVSGQSETARETLNAAIGVIFVIITTMYMLTKQTEIEQEKELHNEIFRKKLQLYESVIGTWQKTCFLDTAINTEQFAACVQAQLQLGMISDPDVLKSGNEIFKDILKVYTDEIERPMYAEEQQAIFEKLAGFIENARKDLELDLVKLPKDLLDSYKANVSKAGVVGNKNLDKFSFKDKILPKNRLVLELVRHVATLDAIGTLADLKEVFPDNFWNKGKETKRNRNAFIVELEAVAARKSARFFGKDEDKIQLRSGEVVVVNSQWADDNLQYLLDNISPEYQLNIRRVKT
jgi:hypothetical protein